MPPVEEEGREEVRRVEREGRWIEGRGGGEGEINFVVEVRQVEGGRV